MRVTPTWVGVGDVSHAVKGVVRLRRVHRGRERGPWRALCATMAALAVLALAGLLRDALPFALAWPAFAAATGFALLAAWHAFVVPDGYAVEIGLRDGTVLEAPAADAGQQERLHAALSRALDWHGGAMVGAPAAWPAHPARMASGHDVVRVIDAHGRVVGEEAVPAHARAHDPIG